MADVWVIDGNYVFLKKLKKQISEKEYKNYLKNKYGKTRKRISITRRSK